MAGPTFPTRLMQAADCDARALVIAFEAARRVFRLDESWDEVSALDGELAAKTQLALYQELAALLRRQTFWLARRAARGSATVAGLIQAYRPAVDALRDAGLDLLSPFERSAADARAKALIRAGAPKDLVRRLVMLRPLTPASDIADMARKARWAPLAVARIHHAVGAAFGFDRVRAAAGSLVEGADPYELMAVRRLIEDLLAEQAAATRAVIAFSGNADAGADPASAKSAVQSWAALRRDQVKAARRTLEEIEAAAGGWSFAKLTIVNAALAALAR